jgi:hypothetical protein
LSFPATLVTPIEFTDEDRSIFCRALEINSDDIIYVGRSIYDLLVEIRSEVFDSITKVEYSAFSHFGGRGVIVTASGSGGDERCRGCDFRSRCFFPMYVLYVDILYSIYFYMEI